MTQAVWTDKNGTHGFPGRSTSLYRMPWVFSDFPYSLKCNRVLDGLTFCVGHKSLCLCVSLFETTPFRGCFAKESFLGLDHFSGLGTRCLFNKTSGSEVFWGHKWVPTPLPQMSLPLPAFHCAIANSLFLLVRLNLGILGQAVLA